MTPYYAVANVTLYHGDALAVLAEMPTASVDAVCTDPPYELGFMGRAWDGSGIAYNVALWKHCARVLKPGGHLLAFGGTRTWHRLTCAVEDAGFEIRDTISWLYGSGFPKSLDVSKAIDKAAGAEREVVGKYVMPADSGAGNAGKVIRSVTAESMFGITAGRNGTDITAPATDDARRWAGWGTALKPAHEPIVVARKPLAGTVAQNVLAHGTGGLNVDGCRVEGVPDSPGTTPTTANGNGVTHGSMTRAAYTTPAGRWPSNVVLDEAMAAELDRQSGVLTSREAIATNPGGVAGYNGVGGTSLIGYGDTGGASRFFPVFRYEPKAPTHERPRDGAAAHPTVKPLDLMRWLVRLVTPPGGVVLDPFAGSGTTAEACVIEGFRCIAVEREADYLPLIVTRLTKPIQPVLEIA